MSQKIGINTNTNQTELVENIELFKNLNINNHFNNYIENIKKYNLHPKISKLFDKWSKKKLHHNNIIIYGPSGIGKYSRALEYISYFSNSSLKYEKKVEIENNKTNYTLKISDIHYEVDMSLLGCNSKQLWNDIYNHIIDIIYAKNSNNGIILCTNFHEIHNELLDNFYSYMQTTFGNIKISFVLVTEHLGFIPDNILHMCYLLHIPRPKLSNYKEIIKINNVNTIIDKNVKINNINSIITNTEDVNKINHYALKIYEKIINYENFKFEEMRELLYDILINNLLFQNIIYELVIILINNNYINSNNIYDILIENYKFLELYNNNYRPIYHLERFIYYLINKIYGL